MYKSHISEMCLIYMVHSVFVRCKKCVLFLDFRAYCFPPFLDCHNTFDVNKWLCVCVGSAMCLFFNFCRSQWEITARVTHLQ